MKTKKNYISAAKILSRYNKPNLQAFQDEAIKCFVALFQDENPRFDEKRFIEAVKKG
jgi:hypothetical protein